MRGIPTVIVSYYYTKLKGQVRIQSNISTLRTSELAVYAVLKYDFISINEQRGNSSEANLFFSFFLNFCLIESSQHICSSSLRPHCFGAGIKPHDRAVNPQHLVQTLFSRRVLAASARRLISIGSVSSD